MDIDTDLIRRQAAMLRQGLERLKTAARAQGRAASITSRQHALARIEAALCRLEAGEFGYCARCGGPIGLQALDLDPTRHVCMDCEG